MEEILKSIDNLYTFIGVESTATVSEIKTAYRKKALACHPDKNPDNPKAAELFLQLSKVLELLTDEAARGAYDRVIKAKLEAKARKSQLDAKRQKLIDDLEAREAAARHGSALSAEQKLKAEIERLQKEGSRQLEEEKERMRQQIFEMLSKGKTEVDDETYCRIKLKWKVENGGYDYDTLFRIMSKYGEIVALVISSGRKGRALVQFQNKDAAELASKVEMGLAHNPLVLEGLWTSKKSKKTITNKRDDSQFMSGSMNLEMSSFQSFSSINDIFASRRNTSNPTYENEVLANLRRAEERKRLMEKIRAEEEEEERKEKETS